MSANSMSLYSENVSSHSWLSADSRVKTKRLLSMLETLFLD